MKQFFIWAGIVLLLYTGLSAGSHLLRSAAGEKILVAVDVSVSLEEYKRRLPAALAFLRENRYAAFKIVTNSPNHELKLIRDWSPELDLSKLAEIKMYTAFPLGRLLEFDELKTADRIVFVTNAADTEILKTVPRSEIVRVR